MFLDEQLNKLSQLTRVVPYIALAILLWLFVMSIIVFLIYFNVTDMHTIIETMKKCVVSL